MPGTRYFPCIEALILEKKKKKNTDELNGYYYYLGFSHKEMKATCSGPSVSKQKA